MTAEIRSFIALDLESEVINQILVLQRALVETNADLKLIEAENIHITLRFLGNIAPSVANRIGEELKVLHFDPFEISLKGVGVFPNMRRINIVWVGVEEGLSDLVSIHSKVELVLKKLNIGSNERRFSPHITVARIRSAKNRDKLSEVIGSMRNRNFGKSFVDVIKLKKSVLTPKGPLYTTMAEARATIREV